MFDHLLEQRNKHEKELQEKAQKHEQELERKKVEYGRDLHKELETLRSELQRAYTHESLVFTKLHEKRVGAIEAVYVKLLPVKEAVAKLIGPFHPVGFDVVVQTKEVIRTHSEFHEAVTAASLFLPRAIARNVNELENKFVTLVNRFNMVVSPPGGRPNTDEWMKLVEEFQSNVETVIQEMTEDMRIALGDPPAHSG